MEFKLNNKDKINLFLVLFMAVVFFIMGGGVIYSGIRNAEVFPLVLGGVAVCWSLYIFIVIFAVVFGRYKSIFIDNETRKFIFSTKNGYEAITFDDIQKARIITADLYPRINISVIKLYDRNNHCHTAVISDWGVFYECIPQDINKSIECRWFINLW